MFIEARDLKNPTIGVTYTTLEIRLTNLLKKGPYFDRDPTSGRLSIQVNDSFPLKKPLYDLRPLIRVPITCLTLHFYVYSTAFPYSQFSDTFYVNTNTSALELFQPLNAHIQDWYEIFIFITDTPTLTKQFYQPLLNNTSLLFISINVLSSAVNIPTFIDATKYMCK